MNPERAQQIALDAMETNQCWEDLIISAILQACAEQRETDAMICDTTAEFHGFYGTAAKDAAVKIRGQT